MSAYNVFGKLEELCNNDLTNEVNSVDYGILPEDSFDLGLSQEVPKNTSRFKKTSKCVQNMEKRRSSRLSTRKHQDTITNEPAVPSPLSAPENLNTSKSVRKRNSRRTETAAATAVPQQTAVPLQASTNENGVVLGIISPNLNTSRSKRRSGRQRRSVAGQQDIISILLTTQLQNSELHNRNATRARSNVIAEQVARLTTIDYIDLVSSPTVPVQGFVNLDSDEEKEAADTRKSYKVPIPEENFDKENPEICIKVMWGEKIESFTLRKYQKFVHLFKNLAELHNCPVDQVVCNLNDQFINKDDTPASLDYKSYNFIYARATHILLNDKVMGSTKSTKNRDTNKINLKIQSDKFKRPLQVEMFKTETFKILYIKCAEELDMITSRIKLRFDGDELDQNDTPAALELDGGEAIDLLILD